MPKQVVLDFGSPSSRSSFEEIQRPAHQIPQYSEELPLHYMADGEARIRHRPVGPSGIDGGFHNDGPSTYIDDDEDGKQVYGKMRASQALRNIPRPPPTNFQEDLLEHLPAAIYTLLSCWTRFHAIGHSPHVVWDEAHFGKFGSYYIKREFYFDVHPPLGKMIVGLVGLLAGYNGRFDFKSGSEYKEEVPYVAMRVMLATFGVLMVPLAWYTSKELGFSNRGAHIVTLMVLFDIAWLVISRFILLDSMLLFFTCLTVFGLTRFHSEQAYPFSLDWWVWLVFTGISIGCVSSVKLVGLFVTALVGVYTIQDLWNKFGDLKMKKIDYIWHWVARGACLIILPFLIYMASFKLHFIILNHSGSGDAQMSSLFQANLEGNDFARNPLEVAYGSKITLKNTGYGGGLLHSHVQTYPSGSQQQQVTCYHYKDENNNWIVHPAWSEEPYNPEGEIRFLKHGDVVRLVHAPTSRNLHSHAVAAPVTKQNNEISCYGNSTVGDTSDHWIVEVSDDLVLGKREKVKHVRSLTTRLRFKHKSQGCYLVAPNVHLPPWGFKQIEVSCDKENNPNDSHALWNIESHWNDRLPAGDVKLYRSPFLRDFWHLNVAMMNSNNALVPDPDKDDILASSPTDWPWLHLGLRMCGWGDNQTKYYLIGNPIVWWSGTASLPVAAVVLIVYLVRMQRGYADWEAGQWDHFLYVLTIAFGGWFFHYVPFLVMGRVTYIHHYLPTLYFSVLMVGLLTDHFVFKSRRLTERTKWIIFFGYAGAIVGTFWWFRGAAWGIDGPIKEHWGLLWRKTWNIYESR